MQITYQRYIVLTYIQQILIFKQSLSLRFLSGRTIISQKSNPIAPSKINRAMISTAPSVMKFPRPNYIAPV